MIEEQIENTGHEAVDFMWGHHPVIGAPFLSERCRLSAPRVRYRSSTTKMGQITGWDFIKRVDGRSSQTVTETHSTCA